MLVLETAQALAPRRSESSAQHAWAACMRAGGLPAAHAPTAGTFREGLLRTQLCGCKSRSHAASRHTPAALRAWHACMHMPAYLACCGIEELAKVVVMRMRMAGAASHHHTSYTAWLQHMEFAWYYSLPALSVKAGCYPLMRQGVPGFQVKRPRADMHGRIQHGTLDSGLKHRAFYFDVIHPDGNTGHRIMAEIAAQSILDAYAQVRVAPCRAAPPHIATCRQASRPQAGLALAGRIGLGDEGCLIPNHRHASLPTLRCGPHTSTACHAWLYA